MPNDISITKIPEDDVKKTQVLSATYKQYLLYQVTEAVKSSVEACRKLNKTWEKITFGIQK